MWRVFLNQLILLPLQKLLILLLLSFVVLLCLSNVIHLTKNIEILETEMKDANDEIFDYEDTIGMTEKAERAEVDDTKNKQLEV